MQRGLVHFSAPLLALRVEAPPGHSKVQASIAMLNGSVFCEFCRECDVSTGRGNLLHTAFPPQLRLHLEMGHSGWLDFEGRDSLVSRQLRDQPTSASTWF